MTDPRLRGSRCFGSIPSVFILWFPKLAHSEGEAASEWGHGAEEARCRGANSGPEELVEGSEEPYKAQGEPSLRALGAQAGKEEVEWGGPW